MQWDVGHCAFYCLTLYIEQLVLPCAIVTLHIHAMAGQASVIRLDEAQFTKGGNYTNTHSARLPDSITVDQSIPQLQQSLCYWGISHTDYTW